jgi:hypothetical protein
MLRAIAMLFTGVCSQAAALVAAVEVQSTMPEVAKATTSSAKAIPSGAARKNVYGNLFGLQQGLTVDEIKKVTTGLTETQTPIFILLERFLSHSSASRLRTYP